MTEPTYTFINKDIQRKLCELVGLDHNAVLALAITVDQMNRIKVNASFYVPHYEQEAEPF